jgi:hypothetical protein
MLVLVLESISASSILYFRSNDAEASRQLKLEQEDEETGVARR